MRFRLAAAVLLFLAAPASGGEIRGTCEVRFLVSSTLHDVHGTARCRPFIAPLARDAAGREILPSVAVEVPVAEMRTGNDTRDGKMREMFESGRHPEVRATSRDIDTGRIREEMGRDREGKASLEIALAIRGVERKIRATAYNLRESGGRVTFDLEFPVSLKDFGLKAPAVLGVIRVADRVVVKGNFVLDVSPSP